MHLRIWATAFNMNSTTEGILVEMIVQSNRLTDSKIRFWEVQYQIMGWHIIIIIVINQEDLCFCEFNSMGH